MSEPDDPRWLADVGAELRKEVEVRPAWRARVLEEITHARQPIAGDDYDDRDDDDVAGIAASRSRDRRIVIRPWIAAAAAVAFALVGAGATFATLSWRARAVSPNDTIAVTKSGATTIPVASTGEVVRFELSAPSASRVALVGSFNEWNPVMTPLIRDASGKWVVAVQLPPGRHVYAFVVDGDVTADPHAPRAADDDFGSPNSVVLVGRS